ncbi:hypothetical protein MRX96_035251 [Rhipicephalus microplus]
MSNGFSDDDAPSPLGTCSSPRHSLASPADHNTGAARVRVNSVKVEACNLKRIISDRNLVFSRATEYAVRPLDSAAKRASSLCTGRALTRAHPLWQCERDSETGAENWRGSAVTLVRGHWHIPEPSPPLAAKRQFTFLARDAIA